ncbi:4-alpha-glucanotransferase [Anaeromyxobacter dehalogenans]|uniref:4-alpha-glucanotransferase n=1 Tax=Anaeromyxobacter dehalogenans (strain 2CP-C) TaxID=290397 RepID=Q2IDW5_ANADE|nr:4-alpha-glucanotransferase [Anaeromyxobacter dehalogenans]ABC82771.1 4-alpha-glucanotransferase [Anaeromyxobacter dehalogenans 2CP-C]
MRDRRSGLLLHPTSLPGPHGAGDLGAAAHRFAGWLADAGQRLWQVLPLGPTGFGDSPYQALSSHAGNPLLVSLEVLRNEGWLDDADLSGAPAGEPGRADLHAALEWKRERLARAARAFRAGADGERAAELEDFRAREAGWLEDWALFAALKAAHGGRPWTAWPAPLARRERAALESARARFAHEVFAEVFAQFAFHRQWAALRARCRALGIELMGDLPIYVAHDSAEVWARPELFRLDAAGEPAAVAGVPPDYFSATGQRWGNPLYDWEAVAREGWRFWIERVRGTLALVDRIRLDHFRGFEAYWEIPAGAPTAERGRWVPGPGARLFEALLRALGPLPFVAENLGVITPEVEALRRRFGLPGMAILQFAFGDDPQAPTFQPHNYAPDLVAYTGTHDNDTVAGWWGGGAGDSVRTAEAVAREKAFALEYLGVDGRDVPGAMIRAVLASVADTAVFPLQDALGLGSEARMNTPATLGGNWRWRVREEALDAALAARLRRLAAVYGRAPAQAGLRSSNQK